MVGSGGVCHAKGTVSNSRLDMDVKLLCLSAEGKDGRQCGSTNRMVKNWL